MSLTYLRGKQKMIYDAVAHLYTNSRRRIAHWLWEHHVIIVASKALVLAQKYDANLDYVFAGALLHDLADVWIERTDVHFEVKSQLKAEQILRKVGYSHSDIVIITQEIIKPHSCHPDNIPQSLEGKVLATADALAHLQSNFYPMLKKMGLPEHINPSNFNEWARTKIDRDFGAKLFFEGEREEARKDFEKLKHIFSP